MSVVAILLLLLPTSSAFDQMILAACKTVGGGSTYFDVQFCEEALGSVAGGGESLNYQVFAGLAVGLLVDNATSTEARIDRLLRGGGGARLKTEDHGAVARCLLSCRSLYGSIVDNGPAYIAAVNSGKFGEATASLEKAAADAKECEDGFGKNKVDSPLSAEDDNAFKLAKLGVALLGFA